MHTESTDTESTWRDYTEQLTGQQAARLAELEQQFGDEPGATEGLLGRAIEHVEGNRIDRELFRHVTAPAEAGRVSHFVTPHAWLG